MGGTGEITLPIGDIDTPLPSLSLSAVSDNTSLVDVGGIVFSDDKVTITPLPNQFGTASITVEVEDDEDETDSEVLVFTVTSVNDAPVAVDDTRSTNEDTDVTWPVVANDSDIDGTITSVDLDPANVGIQTTLSNAAGQWDVASGDIRYDPALNYTGPASVTYVAIDNDNSASNIATVSVTINSVNDLPRHQSDTTGNDRRKYNSWSDNVSGFRCGNADCVFDIYTINKQPYPGSANWDRIQWKRCDDHTIG